MSMTLPDRAWKLEGPWAVAAIMAGGLVVAYGALQEPLLTAGFLGLGIFLASVWHVRSRALPRLFLVSLTGLLAGYAMIGRGFAHVGVPPFFYVGEVVLFLGVLAVVLAGGLRTALRSPILLLVLIFMAWCALQTIPYIGKYGLDALRDGATWGYGAFAVLVAGMLLRNGHPAQVITFYRRLVPWVILAIPFIILNDRKILNIVITLPGSGMNLFNPRPGPMSVHLAGVGVFLALGLYGMLPQHRAKSSPWKETVLVFLWLFAAMNTALLNRGGMLAMGTALLFTMIIRPSGRWLKVAAVAGFFFAILLVFDPQVSVESGREFSPRQLVENLESVFFEGEDQGMQNTKEWRLRWWSKIIDYTIFGPYFWTGKGFGINLAAADNRPNVEQEGVLLRSPHNSHMTILARAGVPGFVLWVLLLSTFGIALLRAYYRARALGQDEWAKVNLWILGFWIAFLVNMSFTVYLEGPHGGIWFWSLMGFGIAALEWQRSTSPVERAPVAASARPRYARARAAS
jgi:hypothetical protein